ncbi:putative enterotoxin [Ophiocordyceps camponoti-rufipedis]|uniref:Putative enterotoxin n=1 Tax=Ophiocordyceps camponoti-rufipedis TaxID=2004952 RepID=A0A2C5Z2H4_9HYPO|nr:putative enterotoxin [Ophiocordyceps camponoti-rufipedis]
MDLELQNGFLPRGLSEGRPHPPPPDLSLYNHVLGTPTGSSPSNSGFVATSKSDRAVRRILSLSLSDVGFIYHIHVSPNFYDVQGSLGGYYMRTSEEEVAALGRIAFGQVLGWIEFRQGVEQPFVKNSKYQHDVFDEQIWGGIEHRLAGFADNHAAWKQEPWKSARRREPFKIPCIAGRKRGLTCDLALKWPDGPANLGENVMKMVKEVETQAEKLFIEFSSKFGLVQRASVDWRMSLPEVRERFKKSRRSVYPSLQNMAAWSRGGLAVTATGQLLYETVSIGTKKMSDLDRAAVLTSILPGVGCSFQAFAAEARGNKDATDVFLCVAADVLMVQGLGLPLLAIDALRSIRKKYLESKMPSAAEMRKLRDEGWTGYQQTMFAFIRSKDFRVMISNQFLAEMAGVMFEAAEALSRLHVIKRHALANLANGHSFEEEATILTTFWKEENLLRSNLSSQAWQRHDRLKGELPHVIKTSLENQAKEFNQIFIDNFEYDVKTNKYEPWAPWGITTGKLERKARAIVDYLKNSQPGTPNLGEIKDRVHNRLTYLETPSFCTEYRPDGGITFRCGDPSDGDNYAQGSAYCDNEACSAYRPPRSQRACETGYSYDERDNRCRRGESPVFKSVAFSGVSARKPARSKKTRTLASSSCVKYRADGGVDFYCFGPSDGDTYSRG